MQAKLNPQKGLEYTLVAQETTNAADGSIGDGSLVEYRMAQTFLVAKDSILTQVELYFDANSGSPSGQVTVRIETTTAGAPSGTLAHASATVAFTPTASAINTIRFANSFAVSAGTYAIVTQCSNQSQDVRWNLKSNTDVNSYPDGSAYYTANAGAWTVYAEDLWFRVYLFNKYTPGKLSFPGFQEILDFTSAGSESSVSVTVDGDTDKEYKIIVKSPGGAAGDIHFRLNGDGGANYGIQYLQNNSGTIAAARAAANNLGAVGGAGIGMGECAVLTPVGLAKTSYLSASSSVSGTTVGYYIFLGGTYNSTANITSLNFVMTSGNFTAGTRITVWARRSQ